MSSLQKHLLPSLLIALLCSGVYALRAEIETYVSSMWVGGLCRHLFDACEGNVLFNCLLALAIFCCTVFVCRRVYHSSGSIPWTIVLAFTATYLFQNKYWTFPELPFPKVGYDALYIASLCAMIIVEVIALLKTWFQKEAPYIDDGKGYCMDKVYVAKKDTGWEGYADELLALMPKARQTQESFAIGISGSWGSGKTTFLDIMRERMKEGYRVIPFNPWMCTSKEQVLQMFFDELGEKLEPEGNSLKNTIRKYRDIVLEADLHPVLSSVARVIPLHNNEVTLQSLKENIEKTITAEGSKPIAILIDDLDRLEGDELFEVLRLIRITANFRNVVYVVAYDRSYVCNVLNRSKNIERAEEFLQKIFHLEVSLPKFEEETLLDVFIEETARIASLSEADSARLKRETQRLMQNDGISFKDFIPNFRQARRFANMFALNLKTVLARTEDIVLSDFLGIELVHFANPEVYQTLMNKPMTMLEIAPKGFSKADIFVFKGKQVAEAKDEEAKKETPCDKLLRVLFSSGRETERTAREIKSKLSFSNYFCYRLPKNAIGVTEFEMAMISEDLEDVRKAVHSWMDREGTFESIYDHFKGYYMHDYREAKVIRNYVCALIEFLPRLSDEGIHRIVSGRYWVRHKIDYDDLQKQVSAVFEEAIDRGQSLEKINIFLTYLTSAYSEDFGPEDDVELWLLEYKHLVSLAGRSLSKYVEQNGKPSPDEVSKKDSQIHKFLMSARYICSYERKGHDALANFSNLMTDALIEQYKGTKADANTFQEFLEPYTIKTDDPSNELYEAQDIKRSIEDIFVRIAKFEEFVKGTFVDEKETREGLEKVKKIVEYAITEG